MSMMWKRNPEAEKHAEEIAAAWPLGREIEYLGVRLVVSYNGEGPLRFTYVTKDGVLREWCLSLAQLKQFDAKP